MELYDVIQICTIYSFYTPRELRLQRGVQSFPVDVCTNPALPGTVGQLEHLRRTPRCSGWWRSSSPSSGPLCTWTPCSPSWIEVWLGGPEKRRLFGSPGACNWEQTNRSCSCSIRWFTKYGCYLAIYIYMQHAWYMLCCRIYDTHNIYTALFESVYVTYPYLHCSISSRHTVDVWSQLIRCPGPDHAILLV